MGQTRCRSRFWTLHFEAVSPSEVPESVQGTELVPGGGRVLSLCAASFSPGFLDPQHNTPGRLGSCSRPFLKLGPATNAP